VLLGADGREAQRFGIADDNADKVENPSRMVVAQGQRRATLHHRHRLRARAGVRW
jgi:hypothetical protein